MLSWCFCEEQVQVATNMCRHALSLLLLFNFLISTILTGPIDKKDDDNNEEYDLIDQRQNGTENYRIDVKDVILVWAPPESLLAAATILEQEHNFEHKKPIEENSETHLNEISVNSTSGNKTKR